MPIDFRSTNNDLGPNTAVILPRPVGVVAGDLLIAAMSVGGGTAVSIFPPSGWTLVSQFNLSNNLRAAWYYKIATDSEPTSYNFSLDVNRNFAAIIAAYFDADGQNPLHAVATASSSSTDSTSYTRNSVSPTTDKTRLLSVVALRDPASRSVNPMSGFTERNDVGVLNNNLYFGVQIQDREIGVGATGTASGSFSAATNFHVCMAAAFNPAPVAVVRDSYEMMVG